MARLFTAWHWIPLGLLLLQATFGIVSHLRPGLAGVVCWYFGSDRLLWAALALLLALVVFVWSLWHRPLLTPSRSFAYAMFGLLALSPYLFNVYPSSRDGKPSRVAFRVPLDGPVTVAWGGATPDQNYHVIAPEQRWAYDLLVTQGGASHAGDGTRLDDYYCYNMPLLSPADGTVVAVDDGHPDMPVGELGGNPAGGNQIVLEVAPGEFLFLCHLKPGSIRVAPGDRVQQGQELARVGNSGNTSEPHLHMHLQTTAEADFGEGIPMPFQNYRSAGRLFERGIPTGGIGDTFKGEIIEHAGVAANQATP
jgi:hypothetical protein